MESFYFGWPSLLRKQAGEIVGKGQMALRGLRELGLPVVRNDEQDLAADLKTLHALPDQRQAEARTAGALRAIRWRCRYVYSPRVGAGTDDGDSNGSVPFGVGSAASDGRTVSAGIVVPLSYENSSVSTSRRNA